MNDSPKGAGRVAGAFFAFARLPGRLRCSVRLTVQVLRVTIAGDASLAPAREGGEQ